MATPEDTPTPVEKTAPFSAPPTPPAPAPSNAYGNQPTPVDVATKIALRALTRQDFSEIGTTGLLAYAGTVVEEFLPELRGQRGKKLLREMADNDAVVGAILFAIDMILRQTEWRLEPNADAQDRELLARELLKGPKGGPPKPGEGEGAAPKPGTPLPPPGQPAAAPASGGAPPPPPAPAPVAKAAGELPSLLSPNPKGGTADSKDGTDSAAPDADSKKFEPPPLITDRIDTAGGQPLPSPSHRYDDSPDEVPVPQKELDDVPDFADLPPLEDMKPELTEAEVAANFVQTVMDDMSISWEETISNILTPMLRYGFVPSEIVYKRRGGYNPDEAWNNSKYDDGKIGWRKLPTRAPETIFRWQFDEHDGNPVGFYQLAPPTYKQTYTPLTKSLLFRTLSEKGNPEGRSILRNAYRSWRFKKHIEEIEAIGIERDLGGIPVAWVPPHLLQKDASEEDKLLLQSIVQMATNVKRNEQEALILPLVYDEDGNKAFEFTLLTSGGRRVFDTDSTIRRYNEAIAMSVIADFVLVGHGSRGAQKLGEIKVSMFLSAVEAWIRNIADVFNKHAFPRLLEVNGMDPQLTPKLTYGKIQRVELPDIGAYLVQLAQAATAGWMDPQLENHMRRIAGLPVKEIPNDEDEEEGDVTTLPPELQAAAAATAMGQPPPGMAAGQAAPPPMAPHTGVVPAGTPGAQATPSAAGHLPPLAAQEGKTRGPYTGESGR